MSPLFRTALLFWCGVALAAPSFACAQAGTIDEARGLFEAGTAAYEAQRYDEALEYFERSYALAPNTSILYNAARSAERGERLERAVELYEQVARDTTDPAERSEATQRLEILSPQLAAENARREAVEVGPVTEPGDGVTHAGDGSQAADSGGGNSMAGAGYALLGGGAALVVLGAVLLAIGITDADAIGATPDGTRSWTSAESDLNRAYALDGVGAASASVGIIGVAVGLGLLASGGNDSSAATSLRISVRGQF